MTEPTSEQLAAGFTCRTKGCFKHHNFGPYVWAHWDLPITHTCGNCGAVSQLQRGVARLSRPGKLRKLDPAKLNGHAPHYHNPQDPVHALLTPAKDKP